MFSGTGLVGAAHCLAVLLLKTELLFLDMNELRLTNEGMIKGWSNLMRIEDLKCWTSGLGFALVNTVVPGFSKAHYFSSRRKA